MSEEGCCRRIYSSGREPYYNLNSTWYDPAGSWLDNRRKPFCYADNTACGSCSRNRCNVARRGGHDYRCYSYRGSGCCSGGTPRVTCCVHNPSGGPRDYWGRPIGDACNGCTGGHYSHTCSGAIAGGCGGGGVCSEPCRNTQASGGAVCAETCGRSSRGCGGGGVCGEPRGASGGCGGGGVCAEPSSRGCGVGGIGVCSEPCARISRAYAEC